MLTVLRASEDWAMVTVTVEEREERSKDEFLERHGALLLSRRGCHISVTDDGQVVEDSEVNQQGSKRRIIVFITADLQVKRNKIRYNC